MMRPAVAWRLSVLGFALACVLLAAVAWTSYSRLVELRDATRWVEHSQDVRRVLEIILSLLTDAENGQRGFIITGQASYLEPYHAALAVLPPRLEQLRRLTADNPSQQANLAALDALIQQQSSVLNATVVARRTGGLDAAARLVLTGEGKRVMDRLRTAVEAMRDEERRLLAERAAHEDGAARAAVATTVGGLGLAFALTLAATVLLNQVVRERGRADAARMQAEAVARAIATSEERLRITLASIGDAVIATDSEGRVTLMNQVAEALTGWSAADGAGRRLEDIFVILDQDTRRAAENPVGKVIREGTVTGLANHTVLIARDGREVPIDDSAAPIRAADGRLVGVVMVFRDITERRQAEEERTQLLARAQAAREEAETANRTKDQFLAVLSHELRTPLNTILGWLQMLQGGRLDLAQQERALETIDRNTRALAQMIDDLLDVSRIAAGKMTLERRRVNLVPLVAETVESLRPEAKVKGLTIQTHLGPAAGLVSADVNRLRQVLMNLLVNAMKYTPSGGHVEIALTREDGAVRIAVRDTGIGIERELLSHVFERFRQANWRSAGTEGGLGLGLAIVREIVEMHGGAVAAESDGHGRGATFIVTLPVIAGAVDVEGAAGA
jgi:PAS domain S-box-containing protein